MTLFSPRNAGIVLAPAPQGRGVKFGASLTRASGTARGAPPAPTGFPAPLRVSQPPSAASSAATTPAPSPVRGVCAASVAAKAATGAGASSSLLGERLANLGSSASAAEAQSSYVAEAFLMLGGSGGGDIGSAKGGGGSWSWTPGLVYAWQPAAATAAGSGRSNTGQGSLAVVLRASWSASGTS